MKNNYTNFLEGKYSSFSKKPNKSSKKENTKSEEEMLSYYDRALALATIGGALVGASVWNAIKNITSKMKEKSLSSNDIAIIQKVKVEIKNTVKDSDEKDRLINFLNDLMSVAKG